jgi:hypothetical protein
MRAVNRASVVSGECARARRVCAMWGFEEDILFYDSFLVDGMIKELVI